MIYHIITTNSNEIGGACSAYGEEERRIERYGGETWGKDITWETQA